MGQNTCGFAEVAPDDGHRGQVVQEGSAVLKHGGVIVDVRDTGMRVALSHQLMHIPLCRQAGPNIYKLAYTLIHYKEPDCPLEELTVFQRGKRHVRR
jgi:hypothetical protein